MATLANGAPRLGHGIVGVLDHGLKGHGRGLLCLHDGRGHGSSLARWLRCRCLDVGFGRRDWLGPTIRCGRCAINGAGRRGFLRLVGTAIKTLAPLATTTSSAAAATAAAPASRTITRVGRYARARDLRLGIHRGDGLDFSRRARVTGLALLPLGLATTTAWLAAAAVAAALGTALLPLAPLLPLPVLATAFAALPIALPSFATTAALAAATATFIAPSIAATPALTALTAFPRHLGGLRLDGRGGDGGRGLGLLEPPE